jgi:hypothetical protein
VGLFGIADRWLIEILCRITRRDKLPYRIPGIPECWEDFGLCILLHMGFPLLPIIFEYSKTNAISLESITIVASMYSIAIGVSSRNKLFFGITLAISIFYAYAFGIISAGSTISGVFDHLARFSIAFVFLAHGLERYNIHVIERTPFPAWTEVKTVINP